MSNPIPPGLTIPSSKSNPATPPIGKPYPGCVSGIAYAGPLIPCNLDTFTIWFIASLSICFISVSDR